VLNENATIEATDRLEMDVSGRIANSSVHEGAENLPQDPSAPRVLDSKAFISSGGDMRLAAGQIVNSGTTIDARRDLLLQSTDIQNLNPYLKWQVVEGNTTKRFEFQPPGSATRLRPEQVRVLWWVNESSEGWYSPWGSDATDSLEPFVKVFGEGASGFSPDTYNRKLLLPSARYPHEKFGRYLGGFGGDLSGMGDRAFVWRRSGDADGVAGAHYPATDPVWADFQVTPGDDAALDAAMAQFYADANSRLVVDFTAIRVTQFTPGVRATQSAAGRMIVGGQLLVAGTAKILNQMSQIIGRDGVDIRSASIDNQTQRVQVTATVHEEAYRTFNRGTHIPNTGFEYAASSHEVPAEVPVLLPVPRMRDPQSADSPQARQAASAVSGEGGAWQQHSASTSTVRAAAIGSVDASGEIAPQALASHAIADVDVDGGLRVREVARLDRTSVRAVERGPVNGQPTSPLNQWDPAGPNRLNMAEVQGRLRAVQVTLTLPRNSLFLLRTDPRAGYLVETDPRFAHYRDWLSSDYLLRQMAADPATAQKRLGDGFYEQRLVREQIGKLTGSTFLDGYASDEEMFRALMTHGATYAKAHQLRPGVALTAEQMAALTTDLVWLVEQTVTLADGSTQRVLVPQVYLLPRDGDLLGTGALIAGRRVDIALSGALQNNGDLRASESLKATAQNIVNDGSMRGASLALSAREDLRTIGGELTATGSMSLSAGRDLVIASTTASASTHTSQRTVLNRVATLSAGGVMVLSAGQDVVLDAARLQQTGADGGVLVQAGRDLMLGTVRTTSSDKLRFDADNHMNRASSREVGTSIQAQGPVVLRAGQDLVAQGASVTSQGAVQLDAKRDLQLLAAQATESIDDASRHTEKGFLKSTTTSSALQLERTTALGTTISGRTVVATAGRDLLVRGSNVVSDEGTILRAERDVSIESARDTAHRSEDRQQVTRGVMRTGGGFTIGTRDRRSGLDQVQETAVGSTIGSVGGNVTIVAGRTYSQLGSVLEAPGGEVGVLAKRIVIDGVEVSDKEVQSTLFRQRGLSVSVGAPALSALGDTGRMLGNIGQVGDARMQALGVATAAVKARDAANALAQAKTGGGVTVGVSVGSSQSLDRVETTTTKHQASAITAGGNVTLIATGDGKDSSISVRGSDLTSGGRLTVLADGKVSLTSSQELLRQRSESSSSSAAAGVAMNLGSRGASVGLTASGSLARGGDDRDDVVQRNTHLRGQLVNVESGDDMALKGAVIAGERVKVKSDGRLDIASLQDTSRFHSDGKQVGGSLTMGTGVSGNASYGQSKVNSDYASVTEQSGIRAGSGGFQVDVKGETNLKGGAITSTQAAVDAGANRFKTGSLALSDIENKADYRGLSFAASGGLSSDKHSTEEIKKDNDAIKSAQANGQYTWSPMSTGQAQQPGQPQAQGNSFGFGESSGHASSTTKAGISGIAGNQAARTGDAESGIKQTFDKEKVQQGIQAQVAITQTFGKEAASQIGAFAEGQLIEADRKEQVAKTLPKGAERTLLEDDAKALRRDWGDSGVLRVAAHAAVGGLTGNVGGAVGAATGTLTAPRVMDAFRNAGVNEDLAKGLTTLASAATGAAATGIAGAGAAFNETTNNYLDHRRPSPTGPRLSEKEQYEAASEACARNEPDACQVAGKLARLSYERNQQLLSVCESPRSVACQIFKQQAVDMGNYLVIADNGGVWAQSSGQGPIRFLNAAFVTSLEPTKAAHEWQANIGTPAIFAMGGGAGAAARLIAGAEGAIQAGTGTAQVVDGDYSAGLFNIVGGSLNIAGTAGGQWLISKPEKIGGLIGDLRKNRRSDDGLNDVKPDWMLADADFGNRPSGRNELTPFKTLFGDAPYAQTLVEHLSEVGSYGAKKGLGGGHSDAAFRNGLAIINGRETIPPNELAPGISVRTYTTPDRDAAGLPPLTKTTYDSRWSDSKIEDLSKRASEKVWVDVQLSGAPIPLVPTQVVVEGVPFLVYFSKNKGGGYSMYAHPGKAKETK
jgi:filamentous hemagglutinin